MKKILLLTLLFWLSGCTMNTTVEQTEVKPQMAEAQHFSGKITGYETANYPFFVKKGQNLNISMATFFPHAYFNILPPQGKEAIFNGSVQGDQFEGVAQETGKYQVQVYMMRAQARRNETIPYQLEIIVGHELPPIQ
ncbi:hypothetical protein [Rodentibacter heidelbergensis]|uniref:DNA breaking-rejoining protein n=1 Tax=Rodentibacter heidelbergensis TaxID=1908258 RepID=A0A1V3I8Y9_9PAST|nr:hypothetical protein [Rodentibacter heidelbergensis]OOF36561.1 hypothetical protein BKK48_04695 [Rodentibacter heidelbergensis]